MRDNPIFFRAHPTKTSTVKVVKREQTKPGSHGAHPGTPGGALRGHSRAPTARGARIQISVGGEGLIDNTITNSSNEWVQP